MKWGISAMNPAILFLLSFFFLLTITLLYYFLIEQPKQNKSKKSNVIPLQNDGFDFIIFKSKIKEMLNDYHRYLADMDVVIYGNSVFIGFLDAKYAYIHLPAKAIQSVHYEPNKVTIQCFKEVVGTKKVVIKGTNSTKDLYTIAKKIDFISRRSKKRVNAI